MYGTDTHFHFVGIGGIGMSGIAKILAQKKYTVSGCDLDTSQLTELSSLGIALFSGNNSPECTTCKPDVVVYSTAVALDAPELVHARSQNIPVLHRSEILGWLTEQYSSITIAGSHGKTTTSSMLSHVLLHAGLDPTVVIGGKIHSINSNAHTGNSQYLVAEADESDRSLVNLFPTYAVIHNIDLEHLETYTDLQDIKNTFKKHLNKLPTDGKIFYFADDTNSCEVVTAQNQQTISYGITSSADWTAQEIQLNQTETKYQLIHNNASVAKITLSIPGEHNVINSLAVIAVAHKLGVSMDKIVEGLQIFSGVDRRFTYKGTFNGAQVIDDYGHHPLEIFYALKTARQITNKDIVVVFQPHRYTRTKHLWNDFIDAFLQSDIAHLIITDIYPAFENPIPGVSAEGFVADIQRKNPKFTVEYIPFEKDFVQLKTSLAQQISENNMLIFQGAGKVNKLAAIISQP